MMNLRQVLQHVLFSKVMDTGYTGVNRSVCANDFFLTVQMRRKLATHATIAPPELLCLGIKVQQGTGAIK